MGVVAGEFRTPEDAGEGGGAVLGGDPRPIPGADCAGVGELVEPGRGALGRGELGGVCEQLRGGADAAGLGGGGDHGAVRRVDLLAGVEGAGEDGDGSRCRVCASLPWAGSTSPVRVVTWAVLVSRPRDIPT
ncbi:MAG: hypothetical protein ACRDRK_16675 [Pseudonocardia sp.]